MTTNTLSTNTPALSRRSFIVGSGAGALGISFGAL